MPVKFIDDGLPESADYDNNFADVQAMPGDRALPPAGHRVWRELRLPRETTMGRVHPKDVRFFQWMEAPARGGTRGREPGLLHRLFASNR